MASSDYCLHVCFYKDKPLEDEYIDRVLKYHNYENNDGNGIIRHLFSAKNMPWLYDIDTSINDDDSVDTLDYRLNMLIKKLLHFGNIIKVEKRTPLYRGENVVSWEIIITIKLLEPIEVFPEYEGLSGDGFVCRGGYGIGLVCRSNDNEENFVFFDEDGILYMLGKNNYSIKEGDIIVFKRQGYYQNNNDDNDNDNEDTEHIGLLEYDILLDSDDAVNPQLRTIVPLDPETDEVETFQRETTWIRKSSSFRIDLFPEYVPFSFLPMFSTNNKMIYDLSMCHFSYCFNNGHYQIKNGLLHNIHWTSYKESILISLFLKSAQADSILASKEVFKKKTKEIEHYVNSLNICEVFSTYQVLINDSRIVNHYDELFTEIEPSINTKDEYIKSLFPMKKESEEHSYEYGQLLRHDVHDKTAEKKAVESAKMRYNKNDHLYSSVYERILPSLEVLVLEREVNRHWALSYFQKLLCPIPSEDLGSFVIEFNKTISPHREATFNYVNIK